MAGLFVFLAVSALAALLAIAAILAHAATHPPRHTAAFALRRGLPIDPAALGFTVEEWSQHVHGKPPILVWDISFTHPSIDARHRIAAVAIHGWGESRIDLLAATQQILPLFARVLVFDRRGHGETAGCARLGDSVELADVAAIAEKLDGGPFALMTTGSGFGLPRGFARTNREKVHGIIAIDPVANDELAVIAHFRAQRWPVQPFWNIARAMLAIAGIGPAHAGGRTEQESDVPTIVVKSDAERKLPDGDLARIREFVTLRTAYSGIEPE